MANFPDVTLPVRVSIAPGADLTQTVDDWEAAGLWVDITDDVREEQAITIEGGRQDEADQVDPTKCTLVLDNRTGKYSPRNTLGPYFGSLKKNCPLKVDLLRFRDTFQRTTSGSWDGAIEFGRDVGGGDTWSASSSGSFTYSVSPGTANVNIGAANLRANPLTNTYIGWNVDTRAQVAVNAVPAGGVAEIGVLVRNANTISYSWRIVARFQTDASITLLIQRREDTSTFTVATISSALTGYTADRKVWIRARANGPTIQGKVWYDGSPEPGSWAATFVETAENLTFDNPGGGLDAYAGMTMLRGSGNTNTTDYRLHSYEVFTSVFTGNVVEWPVRWDKSANDCYAPVTAAGVMRRLQQGQAALGSPLTRTLTGPAPIAYWPLEDAGGATSAAGYGAQVKPATAYEVDFGGWDGLPLDGATSTAAITQDTTLSGNIPSTSTPTGWSMVAFLNLAAFPPLGPPYALPIQLRSSGTAEVWSVRADSSFGFNVLAQDDARTTLANESVTGAAAQWHALYLQVAQSGGNVDVSFSSINLSTGVVSTNTGVYAGTVGSPKSWTVYGDSTTMPEASFGHIAFYDGIQDFTTAQLLAAGRGYAGETATDRISRLCGEHGVPIELLGSSTTLMGPQRPGTFLEIVREAEATDLGILYETRHTIGLGYRPRTARSSTTSRIAVPLANGFVAEPLEPVDDDQRLRNDWTVARVGGSSARVTDSQHITEYGLYDDSAEINVSSDDVLVDHAGLRVFLGTADHVRWPSVTLNLAKASATSWIAWWLSTRVGSFFTLRDLPDQLLVHDPVLVIEGWRETLGLYEYSLELMCSPAEPWMSQRYAAGPNADSSYDGLIDSSESTLDAGVTSSATSIAVSRPSGTARWTTDPADLPITIDVLGELMTVTAISGTGTTQTFTVTRGFGVATARAHSAGEPIRLWRPTVASL